VRGGSALRVREPLEEEEERDARRYQLVRL